jgi:peptidoglycan/LPS O-acetylase OafA/YrhL
MVKEKKIWALTGLRGLAALSVCLGHCGFSLFRVIPSTTLDFLYRTLKVGPNSVQIFFVLSGFLLAFLYPRVTSPLEFIQKRYARFFPLVVVVLLFYSLVTLNLIVGPWYQELFLLLLLSLGFNFLARFGGRFNQSGKLGKAVFWLFASVQLITFLINIIFGQKLLAIVNPFFYKLWGIAANLTVTNLFLRGLPGLVAAFWTLLPELLFYLSFPYLVRPLLNLGKKNGPLVSGLLIILVLKILFNFDDTLRGTAGLFYLNIARMSGFVIGSVIGTIYQSKGWLFQKLIGFFSQTSVNILVLLLFILAQVGDWLWRDGQTIWFNNYYYLFSSLIIGLLVLTLVIPKTLNERLFNNRVLVFCGTVSFPLYLIHSRVLIWLGQITGFFRPLIFSSAWLSVVELLIYLAISLAVSLALHLLVERLPQSWSNEPTKKPWVKKSPVFIFQTSIRFFSFLVPLLLVIWIYTGSYAKTLFLSQHYRLNKSWLFSPQDLRQTKLVFPFQAKSNNLGALTASLWYFQSADTTSKTATEPAVLTFRLFEKGRNQPLFVSERLAYKVESEPNYPFGFPPLANSQNKLYYLELSLQRAQPKDTVFFNNRFGITAAYLSDRGTFLQKFCLLVGNRLL